MNLPSGFDADCGWIRRAGSMPSEMATSAGDSLSWYSLLALADGVATTVSSLELRRLSISLK
jgi:hypothetical protein